MFEAEASKAQLQGMKVRHFHRLPPHIRSGIEEQCRQPIVKYSTILAEVFHRVVLDEGHKVKYPQTLAANMVKLLKAPCKWILTATPMMNRAIDYLGYLHLLWEEDMVLEDKDKPEDTKDLYTDDTIAPTKTKTYKIYAKYEFRRHRLPLWRLDPCDYKFVMTERQVSLFALIALISNEKRWKRNPTLFRHYSDLSSSDEETKAGAGMEEDAADVIKEEEEDDDGSEEEQTIIVEKHQPRLEMRGKKGKPALEATSVKIKRDIFGKVSKFQDL